MQTLFTQVSAFLCAVQTVFSNYASVSSKTFVVSLLVEFIGTMIFTFLGSTVSDPVHGPWVNGLALAIWIYAAANISGRYCLCVHVSV
jgi:hypothetical protein